MEANWSKKWLKWLAIFGIWTLFAFFFTSQSFLQQQLFPNPPSFWKILSWQLCSGWVWFSFMPLILWLIKKFPLDNASWWKNFPLHIIFSVVISLIQLGIDAFLLPKLGYSPTGPFTSFWHAYKVFLMINIHFGIAIYWGALGIKHTIKYYQKFQERELATSQLETRLAQSRLQILKFQLQPHFLFNTLNTISELIYKDPESAERMLTDLSDLLRLSLEKLEVQEVSLQQELDFLKKYVEIEQIRFHDRLAVEMDVAPETLDAKVPNMILQPLVENAIKHGIAPLSQGGTIKIRAVRQNGTLKLSVADNGVGLTNLDISLIPEGVGLRNTKSRLKHLYGAEHKFEILPIEEGGVRLNLEIPYQKQNEN